MKKSKVLIATLALSAALMGTGYAYWTKTLTVDATVTSAKFDVYFSDTSFETTAANAAGIDNSQTEVKNTGTINDTKDNITYEWNNIYPGSQAILKFTINNDSTIPVHTKPVITATYGKADKAKDDAQGIEKALVYTIKINGTQCGNAKMTEAEMKTTLGAIDAKIDKEANVPVEVLVEMPTDVIDLAAEGDKVTLNAKMVWGQFNDQAPTDPTQSPAPTIPAQ